MVDIDRLLGEATAEIEAAGDLRRLDEIKAKYLGKSGSIAALLKGLASLPPEERRSQGQTVNARKNEFSQKLEARRERLLKDQLDERLKAEALDVTLPGRPAPVGGLHPLTLARMRIEALFRSMGFDVGDGPEIERDFYNFQALNIPKNHPARDMQDTFYVENGDVLRTHTSPIQARYMLQKKEPPFRVIAPGKVYRVDSDATHSPMFNQIEGLWVEEGVTFADLKSVFRMFVRAFFEADDLNVRFRPSFFPFTEPSAEIDVMGERGWLEVGGCGMVHPNVLTGMGIDPERYTGFAFGIGIDRFAMLRYKVNDLRQFFNNDLRFLRQFRQ